jgi:hypothetical protein
MVSKLGDDLIRVLAGTHLIIFPLEEVAFFPISASRAGIEPSACLVPTTHFLEEQGGTW